MTLRRVVRHVLNAGVGQGSALQTRSYGHVPHNMEIFGMTNSSAEFYILWI